MTRQTAADREAERIEAMLDVGLRALRAGDEVGAEMALKAALETANRLPKKPPDVICLPDRSGERPGGGDG